MSRPILTASIITTNKASITNDKDIHGWGKDAINTLVKGEIVDITIKKDGESQFGLRILQDGQLILTDYAGMFYQIYLEHNFTMYPSRPWSEAKDKEKQIAES